MAMDVREKLVELLTEFYGSDPMYYGVDALAIAQHLIGNDVTPVVRCKDCKYGEVDDADLPTQYLCNYHGADWNGENHFCGYGERKEDK